MTTSLKSIAKTVIQLPTKDRIFLTECLLDSLEQADLEQTWVEEAKRRRNEIRSGKVKPVPAEEVYLRIEQLLRK